MGIESPEERRRRWLTRLGMPVQLDFAMLPISDVQPLGPTSTIAMGEIASGVIAIGDSLECVGYWDQPIDVVVRTLETPDAAGRVFPKVSAQAGLVAGMTLEHQEGARVEVGQCVATPHRLELLRTIDADVWLLEAGDVPGSAIEQRSMLREITAGRGLELFFHTRAIGATVTSAWTPTHGAEYQLSFELDAPVAIYTGARFGLQYEALTLGVGFVRRL